MIRLARTTTFEHTVSGLLKKRSDLFNEAELIRDRLAELRNDITAIDRVLGTLDYKGDLDAAMPRQKREVLFGRGELRKAVQNQLRLATKPMTSREIAQEITAIGGMDARDRRFVSGLTKRVGKVLRVLKLDDRVVKATDSGGNIVWSRVLVKLNPI